MWGGWRQSRRGCRRAARARSRLRSGPGAGGAGRRRRLSGGAGRAPPPGERSDASGRGRSDAEQSATEHRRGAAGVGQPLPARLAGARASRCRTSWCDPGATVEPGEEDPCRRAERRRRRAERRQSRTPAPASAIATSDSEEAVGARSGSRRGIRGCGARRVSGYSGGAREPGGRSPRGSGQRLASARGACRGGGSDLRTAAVGEADRGRGDVRARGSLRRVDPRRRRGARRASARDPRPGLRRVGEPGGVRLPRAPRRGRPVGAEPVRPRPREGGHGGRSDGARHDAEPDRPLLRDDARCRRGGHSARGRRGDRDDVRRRLGRRWRSQPAPRRRPAVEPGLGAGADRPGRLGAPRGPRGERGDGRPGGDGGARRRRTTGRAGGRSDDAAVGVGRRLRRAGVGRCRGADVRGHDDGVLRAREGGRR